MRRLTRPSRRCFTTTPTILPIPAIIFGLIFGAVFGLMFGSWPPGVGDEVTGGE
jgi:hypothetical protein